MFNLKGAIIDSCPCIDGVWAEGIKVKLFEKFYFCPYFHVPIVGFSARRDKVADFIELFSRVDDLVCKGYYVFKYMKVILTRNTCNMYDKPGRELLNIVIQDMHVHYISGIHDGACKQKEDFLFLVLHVFCEKIFCPSERTPVFARI